MLIIQCFITLYKTKNIMKEFWDQRFSIDEYVYGQHPNTFIAKFIDNNSPGYGFFPGEGEGRNAVYAALNGWSADCFDFSTEGKKKALQLANKYEVSINYEVGDITLHELSDNQYDAVFLTFLHLHQSLRKQAHHKLINSLKPGGHIVMEVFDKKQIERNTGGPKSIEMLYSPDELKEDFQDIHIIKNDMDLRYIEEGSHHTGEAYTIQFIARK